MNEKQKSTTPIRGMEALAAAFANLPPDHAMYKRELLLNPVVDTFGEHRQKRTLVQGRARIQEEVDMGGTVMFSIFNEDGTKKVVGVGTTPDSLDPSRGGQLMLGAGRDQHGADKYLMLVHQGIEGTPPKPFYLSAEQLRNISIAPGDENVTFNPFMESQAQGRTLQITGKVENVIVLE